MMRSTNSWRPSVAFTLAAVLALSGIGLAGAPAATAAPAAAAMITAADEGLEEDVNATLAGLTTVQRNRLMWGDGSVNTVAQGGVPALNMSDGPLGVNAGNGTAFGSGLVISSTWNRDLIQQVGDVVGKEAKYLGKEFHLAPGTNLTRDLGGGRVFEYYSEDPYLSAQATAEYVEGEQANKVAVTIKHIVGNNVETNRNWVPSNMSERALQEVYLAPYRTAIEDADAWGLMTSAARINGTFVSDNRYVLTNMSKYDWGLSGIVMTDWIAARTDIISAKAGLDISMPGAGAGFDRLASYVTEGKLPASAIDNAAQRVTRISKLTEGGSGEFNTSANRAVALQVAEEGVVLLKNQDSILPLPESATQVALLGKYVNQEFEGQGQYNGGSSNMNPSDQKSYLEGLNNYKSQYGLSTQFVVPTYSEASETALQAAIDDAVAAAQASDYAVIFAGINKGNPYLGGDGGPDSEDGDVFDLTFPNAQLRLIQAVAAAAPNKTVVVMNGSAREIRDFADDVKGIMTMFYGGEEGGTAVAEVLFGQVNPSGKLPFTWPKRYNETSGYITTAPAGHTAQRDAKVNDNFYTEGINLGYRWYDAQGITPEYAFGHGLSYTTFAYGTPTLSAATMGPDDSITLSVPVTNTGTRDGKETVQLYISDQVASVSRPVKELKDFVKLDIPAGQTRTATFTIDKDDLSFWDVDAHSFIAEAGIFNALVGGAADALLAPVPFTLGASSSPDPDYTVIQAEAAASSAGVTNAVNYEVDDPGLTVPVNHIVFDANTSEATYNATVAEAGQYSVIVRYSNDSYAGSASGAASFGTNKVTDLQVGGVTQAKYDFQNTRYQNVWNYDSIDVNLPAGTSALTLKATDATPGLRVDKIVLQKIAQRFPDPVPASDTGVITPPEETEDGNVYQAETGRQFTNSGVTAGYTGFTGTGYVDVKAGGAFVMDVTGDSTMAGRLQLTYANGGNQAAPVDVYVNGSKVYTLTLGATGAWTNWKYEQTPALPLSLGNNVIRFESPEGRVLVDKVLQYGGMGYLDEAAPVVNGTGPADGAETMHSWAEVYFSETVERGPGAVTLYDGATPVPSTTSVSGAALRITPSVPLQTGVTYRVVVAADAIHDVLDVNNQATRDLAAEFSFEFAKQAPTAPSDDNFVFGGTWTDDGVGGKVAGDGAWVEWYYRGTQVAAFGHGTGTLSVVNEDAETSSYDVDLDALGSDELFGAAYPDGLHYVRLTKPAGATFTFTGAATDGALVKPLSKAGWTANAFANLYAGEPVSNIVDGNRDARWPSGSYLAVGNWVSLDFGSPITLNALALVSRDASYFHEYSLYASDDGVTWGDPISSGTLTAEWDAIRFPSLTTQYLKIVSNGTSSSKWLCINEAYAFDLPSSDSTPPTTPTNLSGEGFNGFTRLSWNASFDDEGIKGYEVYRDGELRGTVIGRLYYVDVDSTGSGSYDYTVVALDSSNNPSEPSTILPISFNKAVKALPQDKWVPSADKDLNPATDGVGFGIDENHATRYSSGAMQSGNEWYMIDFDAVYPLDRVQIDGGGGNDYGRAFTIQVSTDGSNWTDVATGVPGAQAPRIQEIVFDQVTARYLRIRQTGSSANSWWAVYEVDVLNAQNLVDPPDVPEPLTTSGYNGFIRLDWAVSNGDVSPSGYIVYRDGVELARTGLAPFYVDLAVAPDVSYSYEVAAIAPSGLISAKSTAQLQATDPAATQIPKSELAKWTGEIHAAIPGHEAPELGDGDETTYWQNPGQGAGNWAKVDLGAVYPLDRVSVVTNSATAFGNTYKVEVSTDGVTWREVASGVTGAEGTTVTDFPLTTGRHIRLTLTAATAGQPWVIHEIWAYVASDLDITLEPPVGVTAAGYNGFVRLDWAAPSTGDAPASYNVYRDGVLIGNSEQLVFVDSTVTPGATYTYEVTSYLMGTIESSPAAAGVAGPVAANVEIPKGPVNYWAGTAWAAHATGPAQNFVDGLPSGAPYVSGAYQAVGSWVQADMGHVYPINEVSIYTDHATDFGKQYNIQVSDDGATWVTVATDITGQQGERLVSFPRVNARYVKAVLTDATTSYWWNLREISVYNYTRYQDLLDALASAAALDPADYTTSTWADLASAVTAAQAVGAGDPEPTVAAALADLTVALDGLAERGDPAELQDLVDAAQAIVDGGALTPASEADLTAAIVLATAVLADAADTTQDQMDAAVAALQAAIDAAEVDTAVLAAVVAAVVALGDVSDVYTADSVAALAEALSDAQEVLALPATAVTETAVDAAIDAITAALVGLAADPASVYAQAAAAAATAAAEAAAALELAAALAQAAAEKDAALAQAEQDKVQALAQAAAAAAADKQAALDQAAQAAAIAAAAAAAAAIAHEEYAVAAAVALAAAEKAEALAAAASDKAEALALAAQDKADALAAAAALADLDKQAALAEAQQAAEAAALAAATAAQAEKVAALAAAALQSERAIEAVLVAAAADMAAALASAAAENATALAASAAEHRAAMAQKEADLAAAQAAAKSAEAAAKDAEATAAAYLAKARAVLDAQVKAAGALAQVAYTPASWALLDKALTAAKAVLADPAASVDQVHAALTALGEALTTLVADPTANVGSTGAKVLTKSVSVAKATFKKGAKPRLVVAVKLSEGTAKGKVAVYVGKKKVKTVKVTKARTVVRLPAKYARGAKVKVKARYLPAAGANGTALTSKAKTFKVKG
jgi:beta-glucosidase